MSAPPSSCPTGAPGPSGPASAAAPDPALDYSAGLERLMGDQAMYQRVLTRFHADYRDKAAHLREALGAGDLPLAQRIAHTLKGAAAMIEARLLRQLAAEVEHALRAGTGVDPRLVERMDRELARVMAQLDVLLQRSSKPGKEPEGELAGASVSSADLARLKPAFAAFGDWGQDELVRFRYPQVESVNHVHTAGNSSGIVDGAGLLLIGNERIGRELGLKPRARIVATALVGTEPMIMLEGPVPATRKVLAKAGLGVDDIDLFELNEAFAAVVLRFQQVMGVADERINVNGGAIAMGHPIGATGAMILGTLLDELERRGLRRGLCTLCAGGGIGIATIIERL